ncbi:small heat shock protein, chloroplastic-like isoform X2 [Macadamia integrifolia]|uniref:small heat shock protein, chloroplastic-like isoform X2 n=1 Tax=Macadamia integrifolia TaxID=60698 RepID=UPI001C4EC9C0|nr:small heat shock protein, chloroplastic-like isoform X2 [Macadamia integrifolia]
MASSIVLRQSSTSGLLNKLFNPIRSVAVAPSATRSFNTNAQMRDYDDNESGGIQLERRPDSSVSHRRESSPSIFTADVFDPFSPTRSLSQVLNLMDQFVDNPYLAASRGMGSGTRAGWNAKEDENGLYVRIDMPGLGKEDVKVSVEQNTLIIKGEGDKEDGDEEGGRRYSSRIDLPEKLYKIDQIKAEMKNGVLRVNIPKVKEEERRDVHQVQIE